MRAVAQVLDHPAMRRFSFIRVRVRVAALAALIVVLAAVTFAPHAAAYTRATVLFADGVLRLPGRPLTWVTAEPERSRLDWGSGFGLLTLPGGDGLAPGLVLVLGADPAPPDDPRVVRLTDSLARLGFAILLTQSDDLDENRVVAGEPAHLVRAFEALEAHPRVQRGRVGFAGLSAGGSLAIVAASSPRIAGRVSWVMAIGPYYDAGTLVASTMAAAFEDGAGGVSAWDVHATTVAVVRETLLATLGPQERASLASGRPLTDGARQVGTLLAAATLRDAEAALAALDAERRATLEAISPRYAMAGLRAPLYLVHDREDPFVPWTESEALAAAIEPAIYHRIDLFEHVKPQPGNVAVLWRDGWRFVRLFATIFERAARAP